MDDAEFTPDRERRRTQAIVLRALRARIDAPLTLLCPSEATAQWFERAVAGQGGGYVALLTWERLLDRCEAAAGLIALTPATDAQRAAWLQRCLREHAERSAGLRDALRIDAMGVAAALSSVLEELRACGWDGDDATVTAACAFLDEHRAARGLAPEGGPAALVRAHLGLLGAAIRALDEALDEARCGDHASRLRRLLAQRHGWSLDVAELFVVDVDRVRPREAALLEALEARGTRVRTAPWVLGARRRSAAPHEVAGPARSVLEAYARAPVVEPVASDDDSVRELRARDPSDEAQGVARWLAALDATARAQTAVLVPAEGGYCARVARALERHGLRAGWSSGEPVAAHPLWQVFRASVRLGLEGPDAVELATALAAPGSGIWGADRDRLTARLRRRKPASWAAVREELWLATDPLEVLRAPEQGAPAELAPEVRAERERELLETRARVDALLRLWEPPSTPLPRDERLRALVDGTLGRFAEPKRFREAFDRARVAAAWTAAARALHEATRAVLQSAAGASAGGLDATDFLAAVERVLGHAPDAPGARRADVVRLAVDARTLYPRPATLVVLGFQRGRFPDVPAPRLLLGPVEVEALRQGGARVCAGLAELADEGLRAVLGDRACRRALAAPSQRLVLVAPERDAAGALVEPSLARRDLHACLAPDLAAARARRPLAWVAAYAEVERAETERARLEDLARELGAALDADDASRVVALVRRCEGDPAALELLRSALRPARDYDFGALLREPFARGAYSPSALELLLKCRYAFCASEVLRLQPLPLARRARLDLRAHVDAAHAALRALDETREAPDEATTLERLEAADAARRSAVQSALAIHAAGEDPATVLARGELARTVRGFVDRYEALRAAWAPVAVLASDPRATSAAATEALAEPGQERADALEDGPRDPRLARPTARLALPTRAAGAPATVTVRAPVPRVEVLEDASGAREGVLVQLRVGGVEAQAKQREAGLSVAPALLPALAEAALGVPVRAVATLSLSKNERELLVATGSRLADEPAAAPLDGAQERALARVAGVVDALLGPAGDAAPHTRQERAALVAAGAKSCEYCASRLLCRFEEGAA